MDILSLVFGAGSLLFVMQRLSKKISNSITKFNIDNSIIKQLFVVDKSSE